MALAEFLEKGFYCQKISVETHHVNVDCNAYEGFELQGAVETVLSRGNVIVENGDYLGKQGDGQFIKRGECIKIQSEF